MFLRACATLEARVGDACLKALAAQAQEQLQHFEARPLSNMLWAFAKLKHNPEAALLRDCEAHARRIVTSFAPQDLVRWCCQIVLASSDPLYGICSKNMHDLICSSSKSVEGLHKNRSLAGKREAKYCLTLL